ncbi:DNA replication complex GINS protein PSF1 [Aphelenchoides fujianensis]|nr:DNA replication complex GINS protein PSF1 [Aphelenchoides fujianensis]
MMSATVDDSLIAHHDTLPVLNDSSSQLPPSSQTTDSQALDLSAPAPRTSESDFAEKAAGLLRELRTNPNFLPPFRLEVVRQCVQEIQRLRNLNAEDFQRAQEAEGADVDAVLLVQMRQATIDRIKRCLCANRSPRKDSETLVKKGVLEYT